MIEPAIAKFTGLSVANQLTTLALPFERRIDNGASNVFIRRTIQMCKPLLKSNDVGVGRFAVIPIVEEPSNQVASGSIA
jgi:hypothetical protein